MRFWRACIGTGTQGPALVLCHSSSHTWRCFAVCQQNPAPFLTLLFYPALGSQVGCGNKHSLEMSILVFITEHLCNNTCIQCQPFHIPPFCSRGVLPYKSTSESARKPSVGEELIIKLQQSRRVKPSLWDSQWVDSALCNCHEDLWGRSSWNNQEKYAQLKL